MNTNNFEIGIAFLYNGDNKKAVEFLTKHITDNPKNSEAYVHRAIAYNNLKEVNYSLADLEMALECDPSNEDAHINKGFHYFQKQEKEKALKSFLLAYDIYSENWNTLTNLVQIYYSNRDFYNAKKYSNELVKLFPDEP